MKIMKTHTVLGAGTLSQVLKEYPHNDFINMGICIARSHHEHWDGKGYPDGLAGEEIPLGARIMTISDIYDALRSKRVYKEAVPHDETCKIINEESGKIFDPRIIQTFNQIEKEFKKIRDSMND